MADTVGAERFVTLLMGAVANCSLYSPGHPAVVEFSQRAEHEFPKSAAGFGRVEIMLLGDDVVVNRSPLRSSGVHERRLVKRLRRLGLGHLDFLPGVTGREIGQFAAALARGDSTLPNLPHIKTGTIDLRLGAQGADESAGRAVELESEQGRLARLRRILHPQSLFQRLDTVGIEEVVASFIATMRREANILRLISPLRSYSEYTFTHASNVMALSLVQAESFGIRGELLRELGIAALLHDIGKLYVPKEVLDKTGRLDEGEWDEILRHPFYGAWYLSKVEGLTRLAPIVAVEHHLRYDGQGYPRPKFYRRGQHVASQIVSIADFFDALRSRRPYKRDWEIPEVLALLHKGAGTEFNPDLVDNFSRILLLALKKG
jgi:HD superfamily phosphohydrolase YqeK